MLKPETATYLAFYIIDQSAIDNGGLVNVATAGNGTVSDTSNVTTTITASPSLEVTKIASVTDEGDNLTGENDVINYTITVKNTGNITLNQLTITDLLPMETVSLIHWRSLVKFNSKVVVWALPRGQ